MSSSEKLRPVIKNLKMGGNEDAFQQLKAALDRATDQILSVIPESDHVDTMCDVVELIEVHTEEEVKYTLGKMCLVLTQLSAGLKAIQLLRHPVLGDISVTLVRRVPKSLDPRTMMEREWWTYPLPPYGFSIPDA